MTKDCITSCIIIIVLLIQSLCHSDRNTDFSRAKNLFIDLFNLYVAYPDILLLFLLLNMSINMISICIPSLEFYHEKKLGTSEIV